MERLQIVKIGGNVIDSPVELEKFLSEFSTLKGKKILVHGGGKIATALGEKLGIQSRYLHGRRITDGDTIDLVTAVYGGLINKQMVAALQGKGINAIGLTGADANLIPAKKRPINPVDFGWVGDVLGKQMPVATWQALLEAGLMPVVAPLTHDGAGHMLNTNADTIATSIAVALSTHYQVSLLFCFEKSGILLNVEDEQSRISQLNPITYKQLKADGCLFAGILPKLDNAFDAIAAGVPEVVIGPSADLPGMLAGRAGTRIAAF